MALNPAQLGRSLAAEGFEFFAILSDIHANVGALEAVLADTRHWPVKGMFCLGDIIGYGPDPDICVEKIMEICAVTVAGNHEIMLHLADHFAAEDAEGTLGKPIQLANERLSEKQKRWLMELPGAAEIDPISLCHASLNEPGNFDYIDSEEPAREHFQAQKTHISFHGHTHIPVIWEESGGEIHAYEPLEEPVRLNPKKRYSINVGSVGQPRDGDPRAAYALYDFANQILLHRRVEYDIPTAQARFRKANLPDWNAWRLEEGE